MLRKILIAGFVFSVVAPNLFAMRSNHNGWHGAAPVKRGKQSRPKPTGSSLPY